MTYGRCYAVNAVALLCFLREAANELDVLAYSVEHAYVRSAISLTHAAVLDDQDLDWPSLLEHSVAAEDLPRSTDPACRTAIRAPQETSSRRQQSYSVRGQNDASTKRIAAPSLSSS